MIKNLLISLGLAVFLATPLNFSYAAQAQGGEINNFDIQPRTALQAAGGSVTVTLKVTLFSPEYRNYCGTTSSNLYWEVNEKLPNEQNAGFKSGNLPFSQFISGQSNDLSFPTIIQARNGVSSRQFFAKIYCKNITSTKIMAVSAPIGTSTPGGGGGCGTPGQPACKPGTTQQYSFEIPNPLKGGARDFTSLVKILAQWIFNLAIPIAVAMIVYSGILFLTAAGEPAKITKAKDVLKWAVVGLAIILIGSGFVTLIQSILELGSPPGPGEEEQLPTSLCQNNVCINGVVGPCETDSDCQPTLSVGAVGNKCSRDRDCISPLKCQDSICKRPTGNWKNEWCNSTKNCDVGLICDKSDSSVDVIDGQTLGLCLDSGVSGGRIGDLCEKDSNCISGLKCNQVCQRKDGNLDGELCVKTADPSNCKSRACKTVGTAVQGICVEYSGT